ncbi:MAG: DUF4446 family protein [Lachnospiraceae bacterium]|jgi:hypothetical protein|nr:DUF4446 family protein [Lachnospiraceae bacterium]
MGLFERLGIDVSYIVIVLFVINVALIVVTVLLYNRQKKMKNNLSVFMNGKDAESLEDAMVEKFSEINEINRLGKASAKEIIDIKDKHMFAFQKFSIVKYDAFKEMGGKLSFSVCMLTDNNDGFIISSMHSTSEGCYVYIKEIIAGEAYVLLSEEEKKVLNEAKTRNNVPEVEL